MKLRYLALALSLCTLTGCQNPRNQNSSGSDMRGRYGTSNGSSSTGNSASTAVPTSSPGLTGTTGTSAGQ